MATMLAKHPNVTSMLAYTIISEQSKVTKALLYTVLIAFELGVSLSEMLFRTKKNKLMNLPKLLPMLLQLSEIAILLD
jgi:hypothetical protein